MKKLLLTLALMLMAINANAQSCPDDNHPHAIDLGLPSGTLWACCNVGATKPEENGGYYAWGEVQEKNYYSLDTYQYYQNGSFVNIGNYIGEDEYGYSIYDISGTRYDVAHVQWGGSWVMPSFDQFEELLRYSSYGGEKWIQINGVGGKFFSFGGSAIFLPAAGGYFATKGLIYVGEGGYYWSSMSVIDTNAHELNIGGAEGGSAYLYYNSGTRSDGLSVRPVISGTSNINIPESPSDISNQAIYNLYGIKVADNAADVNTLPSGIYIVNGKKMVVK